MYTMKEFLQNIVDKNKNILCFGTGLMAREVLEYEEMCARTHYLIDNDVWKQGKIMEINGKDFLVISPEQMIENSNNFGIRLFQRNKKTTSETGYNTGYRNSGIPDNESKLFV